MKPSLRFFARSTFFTLVAWVGLDASAACPSPKPCILVQPRSVSLTAGQSTQLKVELGNAVAVRYKWYKDGILVAPEAASILTITGASASHVGFYYVDIIADGTHLVSDNASITVKLPAAAASTLSAWIDKYIVDPQLKTLVKKLSLDGLMSRSDMLAVLKEAGGDDGIVNAKELSDLRLMVQNSETLKIPADVKNLSSKVVNFNVANARYQKKALGQLKANDSKAKLEKLVSKWFRGLDLPEARVYSGNDVGGTPYRYMTSNGKLLIDSMSITDVVQGLVSNCYFHAAVAATAYRLPKIIPSNFINNGDGTYSVRFYKNGVASYVTVNSQLPVDAEGKLVFAGLQAPSLNPAIEIWEPLMEKAYAQINEEAWVGQSGTNSYQGLNFGWSQLAYSQITGRTASPEPSMTLSLGSDNMLATFNSGKPMFLVTKAAPRMSEITPNHVYVVTGYDAASQAYTFYNPWGMHQGPYVWNQVAPNFDSLAVGN